MKSYKASKRIMSNEYIRGYKKLDKPQKLGIPSLASIRSITPDAVLAKKDSMKHQCSFSYVGETKTPGVKNRSK